MQIFRDLCSSPLKCFTPQRESQIEGTKTLPKIRIYNGTAQHSLDTFIPARTVRGTPNELRSLYDAHIREAARAQRAADTKAIEAARKAVAAPSSSTEPHSESRSVLTADFKAKIANKKASFDGFHLCPEDRIESGLDLVNELIAAMNHEFETLHTLKSARAELSDLHQQARQARRTLRLIEDLDDLSREQTPDLVWPAIRRSRRTIAKQLERIESAKAELLGQTTSSR